VLVVQVLLGVLVVVVVLVLRRGLKSTHVNNQGIVVVVLDVTRVNRAAEGRLTLRHKPAQAHGTQCSMG
jgi:hypothetical protein